MWKSYVKQPLTISFVISLVVIFVLAKCLPKYYTGIKEELLLTNNGEVFLNDLDNNGKNEKIHYHQYDRIFPPTLYLYDSDEKFKNMWSFQDSPIKNSRIYIGDFNNDSINEIFVFTTTRDSLFLYVINSHDDKELYLKRRFITSGNFSEPLYRVMPMGLFKLTGNNKSFVFSVNWLSPLASKRVYALNLEDNKLHKSPQLNMGISDQIIVDDMNSDNKLELIIPESSVSTDSKNTETRIVILDNKLQIKYRPIVFNGGPTKIYANVIDLKDKKAIAILHTGLNSKNVFNNLMLYNVSGELIKEINLDFENNLKLLDIGDKENIYLFTGNNIFKYNVNLEKEKSYKLSRNRKTDLIDIVNLTNSKLDDIVFQEGNELFIVTDNFNYRTKLNVKAGKNTIIDVVYNNNQPNQLVIQSDNKWYLLDFYRNEAFFYGQVFYFVLFIFITFLTFIIWKIVSNYKIVRSSLIKDIHENNYSGFEENLEEVNVNPESDFKDLIKDINISTYQQTTNISDNKKQEENMVLSVNNELKQELHVLFEKYSLEKDKLCFYPDNGFMDINPKLTKDIITFIDKLLESIKIHIPNIFTLQFVKHPDYLNILLEIENENFDAIVFNNNNELSSLLSILRGTIEVGNFNDFGSIVNCTIPFSEQESVRVDNQQIRVIIAEDHDVSLFGLISLFKTDEEIEVIGTAKNGMEVLKLLETKETDIVVTDISMPGMDGIELSERLKNEYPEIKLIVFTMYMENWFVDQLRNNGAKGFVSKNSKTIELLSAVKNVYDGHNYYCPQFKSKFGLNGDNKPSGNLDSLTKNEMHIIKQYAENLNKEQIAQRMNLSMKTIDTFVANILLKLNAADVSEIIHIAKKQKFISE